MTEEEIRPIAENYVEEYCHCPDGEYTDGSLVCAGIGTALIVSRQLEKQIVELKKENAELKSIADFQQSGNMSRYFELKRQAEKLEEAKELLKKLLVHSKRYIWIADDNNKPIMQKEIAEAEQFLSEVEK